MLTSYIVVGLGYGDEGKGSWVDHLVRAHKARYVVRFNGGAQAAHHVVTPEGITHCFAQFGSGSFVPDTATILSRFMLVDPEAWLNESAILLRKGAKPEVLLSENAPIIIPSSKLLNRIQERARGSGRHGSCGFGIGITQHDVETLGEQALFARDLKSAKLADKLTSLHRRKLEFAATIAAAECDPLMEQLRNLDLKYYEELFRCFAERVQVVGDHEIATILRSNSAVFEGAQGVLLDQHFGFFPHCTRSTCTFENAETLLREAGFSGAVNRVGLLRGYSTRHGAGPLVTAEPAIGIPPCHNAQNEWQGEFRLGWFDAVAARYALEVTGRVDTLAITNLDRMRGLTSAKVATRYSGHDTRFFSDDGERIHVLKHDAFSLRAERTGSMNSILPVYEEVPELELKSREGVERYLDILASEIGHPIQAFSESIDYQKLYR